MMRKPWGGLCAAILLVGLVSFTGISAAESQPEPSQPARLVAVKAVERPTGTSLEVLASGPFSFTSYQPHDRSVVVDLAGVVSAPAALEPATGLAWIASYRVLPFRGAGGRPVLRLDLTLKRSCEVKLTQPDRTTLLLSCPTATTASAPAATSKPASAPATKTSSEPVRVRDLAVHQQGNKVTVEVQATGTLTYEAQTLANPTRLVIDLPQSLLLSRQRRLAIGEQGITGVRVAQYKAQPPITRLVVDLKEIVPYQITPTPGGLRLTLRPSAAASNPAPAAAATSTPQMAEASPAPAAPEPESSAPAQVESATPESAPVLVASLAPTVPARVRSTAPAPVAVAPVALASIESAPPTPAAPLAVATTTAAPEAQQATATAGEPPKRFTGEPISVNFKDLDIKDFFRLIHEISGYNIIVDPGVSGSVTLVLVDVPWDQALDIVLKNNSLSSTLEGNVLRIATRTTLKKEQEDQRDLAKAVAEAVAPVTVTRQLSYARAADLEPTLKRFLSSRGEVIRDERTNTLIIRDIPSVIPVLDDLIKQLDRKSLQVEIEARVVSASRAFAREIGSQFATSFSTTSGRSVFGGALGPSPFSSPVLPPPLISGTAGGAGSSAQPLVSDFRAAATSGFLFGHRSPSFALDTILTAAESRNIAKVLSRPRLVTQNNVQAEVKQGTRIPVQTVVNNTVTTQFLDVVLRLNVTPQITAEGTVFLNIVIENSTINPGIARINGIPALTTQATTTQVLVPDGGTIVVGGVMTTNNSTSVVQVPLLGSIPIIGHLFKRTTIDTSSDELLFFITPRILPG